MGCCASKKAVQAYGEEETKDGKKLADIIPDYYFSSRKRSIKE